MSDDKPKMIAVTDPAEVEELLADTADLAKPFPIKPNGQLWAQADQMQAWRESRK